jgi:hypothetical protein
LEIDPEHALALNNKGLALGKLGKLKSLFKRFRIQKIKWFTSEGKPVYEQQL